MLVGNNCVVSIHYELTDNDGNIIDASPQNQPLKYLHGNMGIIPGLEKELTGKAIGSNFKVSVSPEEGYGEHQPMLVQAVPVSAFPEPATIEIGMQFQAQTEGGPVMVTVTEVSDETITVDGNHPLAGMTLNFTGSIADVRAATGEEISHGHVH